MTGQITTPPWAKPKPAKAAPHTIDPLIRRKVWQRAAGACELCAGHLGRSDSDWWECHHRLLRSRGGQDTPTNLVALCATCHKGVHKRPSWAGSHGWMVSQFGGVDPADVAITLHCRRQVLLTDSYGYRDCETGSAA